VSRCRWISDPQERWFMPGCMGGAAMGDGYCTCKITPQADRKYADLERRITRLERSISRQVSGEPDQ
jgi:hypothetical protein